jgi:hypothetical protein
LATLAEIAMQMVRPAIRAAPALLVTNSAAPQIRDSDCHERAMQKTASLGTTPQAPYPECQDFEVERLP